MAPSRECYVDTPALIAFREKSDLYHSLFVRLFSAPPPLVSSALVIAEGHGWFLRRHDEYRAIEFLRFVQELPLQILAFGKTELNEAARIARKFSDQGLTLADAHGLIIMGTRRITEAWSTDRHLTLTGARLAITPR